MGFFLKTLPKEDTIRETAVRFRTNDLTAPQIESFILLNKFVADCDRALEEHYKQFDLSDGRFMVMITLKKSQERLKATDIANELGVSRATMTGLIDSLIRDEFIVKKDCKEDRRISYLELTAKAHAHLDGMFPVHFRKIAKFMNCLNEEEVAQLKSLVTTLQGNLSVFLEPKANP